MTLLIDNYDSFSYNLYQYVGEIDPDIKVVRNDELGVDDIRALNPGRIIISPGPGRPENAGIIVDAVRELGGDIPILGICLGHQAICLAYGGVVTYADKMMHGKQSWVEVDGDCPLFAGLEKRILVARYHSLAADKTKMPEELKITAETDDGEIMAVMHRTKQVYGLQFHPESIMTPMGRKMISNFLGMK